MTPPTQTPAERDAILRRNRRRQLIGRAQFAAIVLADAFLILLALYAASPADGEPWAVGDYATAPATQPTP